MSQPVKEIDFLNGVGLLSFAGSIELVQAGTKVFHAIAIVGNISAVLIGIVLSIIALIVILLWLTIIGVPILPVLPFLMGTTMLELTPIFNILPGWLGFVIATLFVVKRKAKYNKQNEVF